MAPQSFGHSPSVSTLLLLAILLHTTPMAVQAVDSIQVDPGWEWRVAGWIGIPLAICVTFILIWCLLILASWSWSLVAVCRERMKRERSARRVSDPPPVRRQNPPPPRSSTTTTTNQTASWGARNEAELPTIAPTSTSSSSSSSSSNWATKTVGIIVPTTTTTASTSTSFPQTNTTTTYPFFAEPSLMQPDVEPIGGSSSSASSSSAGLFGGPTMAAAQSHPFYDVTSSNFPTTTTTSSFIPTTTAMMMMPSGSNPMAASSSSTSRDTSSIDRIPPSQWNSSQVGMWLCRIGMEEHCLSFESQDITGLALLKLSDSDLIQLNVGKLGHRKLILSEIESLRTTTDEKKTIPPPRSQQGGDEIPTFSTIPPPADAEDLPHPPEPRAEESPRPPEPPAEEPPPWYSSNADPAPRHSFRPLGWLRYVKACIPPMPNDITYKPDPHNICGFIFVLLGTVLIPPGKHSRSRSRASLLFGFLMTSFVTNVIGGFIAIFVVPWAVLESSGGWLWYPPLIITAISYIISCFSLLLVVGDVLGELPSRQSNEDLSFQFHIVIGITIFSVVFFHVSAVVIFILTELYSTWKFVFYMYGSVGHFMCWGLGHLIVFGGAKLWGAYRQRLSQIQ